MSTALLTRQYVATTRRASTYLRLVMRLVHEEGLSRLAQLHVQVHRLTVDLNVHLNNKKQTQS